MQLEHFLTPAGIIVAAWILSRPIRRLAYIMFNTVPELKQQLQEQSDKLDIIIEQNHILAGVLVHVDADVDYLAKWIADHLNGGATPEELLEISEKLDQQRQKIDAAKAGLDEITAKAQAIDEKTPDQQSTIEGNTVEGSEGGILVDNGAPIAGVSNDGA